MDGDPFKQVGYQADDQNALTLPKIATAALDKNVLRTAGCPRRYLHAILTELKDWTTELPNKTSSNDKKGFP